MTRRIGFGDGDGDGDGDKRPAPKPMKRPETGRKPTRGAPAPPPDNGAIVTRKSRNGLWRALLTLGVVIGATQIAVTRLGGGAALLSLPDRVLDGALGPVELTQALGPPLLVGAFAIFMIRLFLPTDRAPEPRDSAGAPAYEATTPRDARAAFEELRRENPELAETAENAEKVASGCGRVFIAGFLLVWLGGWTLGILFAASEFLRGLSEGVGPDTIFLGFWTVVASVAWLFAVRVLIATVRGEPLSKALGKKKS